MSHYILRVSHVDITANQKKLNDSELYVEVHLGKQKWRTIAVKDVPPVWNVSIPLRCTGLTSEHILKIKKESRIRDSCIFEASCSLSEILDNNELDRVPLRPAKSETDSHISLFLQLRTSDPMKNSQLHLRIIAQSLLGITLSDDDNDTIGKVDALIKTAKDIIQSEECQVIIGQCRNIKAFLEFGNLISSANPYLTLGWCITSGLIKIIVDQRIEDKKVKDLAKDLMNLFLLVEDTFCFKNPIKSLSATIADIFDLIAQFSMLVQSYAPKKFIVRAVMLNKKAELGELELSLAKLKDDLSSAIGHQGTFENVGRAKERGDKEDLKELKERLRASYSAGKRERKECLPGTRIRLLEEIGEWINSTTAPNVLFLLGAAGTGKSTIARTVAEMYEDQLVSEQYFEREKGDPALIFRTIACDLAERSPTIAKAIKAGLDNKNIQNATARKTFDLLLHKPLHVVENEVERKGNVLVILDALDECGNRESREEYIRLMKENLPSLPPRYRFLVTSRPESDIVPLSTDPGIQKIWVENEQDSKSDVTLYIRHELGRLVEIRKTLRSDWEKYALDLSEAAGGLFIWAATAIGLIKRNVGHMGRELRRLATTKKLSSGDHTSRLYHLYADALRVSLHWDEEMKINFSGVFSLILFSKEQLIEETINQILGLAAGESWNILNSLRSLVAFDPDNHGQPVRLHHNSFYDYLTSKEASSEVWFIDECKQKTYIANLCFDVMKSQLKFNICGLENSFKRNEEVLELEEYIRGNISSSLLYSCRHWASHLWDSPYSDSLSIQLETFALTRLLFWIEVLSLTRTLHACGLSALASALEWLELRHTKLTNFLTDARSQLNVFLYPMSQSVPHIYMSFLPVMKETSIVAMHYAKQSPPLSSVEYIGERAQTAYIRSIDVGSPVLSISHSRDGTRIASGSDDGVCIWDAKGGILLLGPLRNKSGANSIVFSPKGDRIVSAEGEGGFTVWDAVSGNIIWNLDKGHNDSVISVAFSACGRYIGTGSNDGTVRLWGTESDTLVGGPLEGRSNSVSSVSFSPNGRYLASCSFGVGINIWDVENRMMVSHLTTEPYTYCVNFSADSENIISGSPNEVSIWDVSTGKMTRKFKEDSMNYVYSVAYSRSGKYILSGSYDGVVRVWSGEDSNIPPKRFEGHISSVSSVSFAPDGTTFASGSLDGTIKVWDVARVGGEGEGNTEGQSDGIHAIACSQNGEYIVSGSSDKTVCLWGVESGECVRKLKGHSGDVTCIAFSSDNLHFASGSMDKTVRIWNINGKFITCLQRSSLPSSVSFSPDGLHLASASGNEIQVWNIKSGEMVGPKFKNDIWLFSVAYSPDGKKFVSRSWDDTIRIWNASNGELLHALEGHIHCINSVQYSDDGSRIISGSGEEMMIWDAESGRRIGQPLREGAWIVCFSPDGQWIASRPYAAGAVHIWNVTSGKLFFQVELEASVNSITFLPTSDSKCIKFASAYQNGVIRIWYVDVDSEERMWKMNDNGWLTGNDNNLLIWIPKDLRRSLMFGPCIRNLNAEFSTRISLSDYRSHQWTERFSPFTEEQTFAMISPSLSTMPHIQSKNYYLYLIFSIACLSFSYFLNT